MGAAHSTGPQFGSRLASNAVRHVIPVTAAQFTAGGRIFTINGSTKLPIIVEAQFYVRAAFTGASPEVLVGTSLAGTQIFAAGNITEATPGFYPASNAVVKLYLTAKTGIFVSKTGTVSAGDGFIILDCYEVNLKAIPRLLAA